MGMEIDIIKRVRLMYQSTVEAKVWKLKLSVCNSHHILEEVAK